ncbi:MAG: TonB-dependent receptor [Acidobacteriota bacterium]
MFKGMIRIAGMLALVVLAGTFQLSMAQGGLGSLSGRVTDSNNAVVPNATVEATNQATGEKRSATTNDDGAYSIPNLSVGLYTVTATGTSFAATTTKDFKISVAFTATQDFVLKPQGAQETVVITTGEAATQLNTTDQQLSTIIEQRKILDLPLLSRDPNALILLSPGTAQSTSGLGGFVVNGQRERNNNFLVDGVDNNDADVPGIPGGIATPNIDATQEFRVITGNFNAEYGRNTGAIITVATKNGTNAFHGGAYIYYRSDAFNARNFFDISGKADPQQRRQFGVSIGGPIKKDKAFFFFNYEGDRFDQGFTLTRVVPTARARQGNFDFGGAVGTINANTNAKYGDVVRPQITAFLNNFFPLPNTGTGPLPGIFENYRFGSQTNDKSNSVASRVDYRISDKHNLSVSFNHNRGNFEFCCETFAGTDDSIKSPQKTYLVAINLISNISPHLINEARVGANRSELFFYGDGEGGTNGAFVQGFRSLIGVLGGPTPANTFGNPNAVLIGFNSPGSGLVTTAPFDTQFRFTGTTTFADAVTYIRGNHTFKVGAEHRRVYTNGASDFGRTEYLDFNYSTNFGDNVLLLNGGGNLPITGTFGTVNNFANLLYGFTDFQTQSQYFNRNGQRTEFDYRGFRVREVDMFFQDNWKVRPNFTLNYGLRYEIKGVPFEVNGQLSTLVDQDPSGPRPANGFTFQLVGKNSGNGSKKLYLNDYNNFAPRFGFAWSPGWQEGMLSKVFGGPGRTSIRGGYGIFYDRVFGNLFSNASGNPPFQQDVFNITFEYLQSLARPTQQTPSPTVPLDAEIFPVLFALPGNNQFQTKFANPYTQAWNLGFQRQFGNNFLIEADYVGNHGLNELRVIDGQMTSVERVNQILGLNRTISPTSTFTNYLNGVLSTDFFQTATNLSVGQSTYHAGQFRITKNLTNKSFGTGQFQAAYTWSHSIDDSADPLVGQSGERTFPRDSSGFAQTASGRSGWRAERGNSGFDVRHRFVMNFLYEVPLKFENSFANAAFGNWALTGIWQWQSGSPFSVFGSSDSAGTALGQRADLADPAAVAGFYTRIAANPALNPRTQVGPTANLFKNPCAGVVNAIGSTCTLQRDGRQGTVGRNVFYGPDYNKFDLALIKRFPLTRFKEGMKLTIRADFFNVFNRVNLDKPNATNININSATFGQATTAGAGRIIQFVGRFDF